MLIRLLKSSLVICEDGGKSWVGQDLALRFKFGARMLEVILDKIYNVAISHNRIHMYLLIQGLSVRDPKKQKRRKWVRYERDHSMSAGHIDWHEDGRTGMMICVILDDASRKILVGGELLAINTENSILVVDQMVWNYWWLCPMRELIMDHGTEFGGNRIQENCSPNSRLRSILKNLVLNLLWQE